MHINTLTNIGTDSSVWIFVGIVMLAMIVLWWVVGYATKHIMLPEGLVWNRSVNKLRYYLMVGCFVCVPWVVFGGYGGGDPVDIGPVEADGSRELNELAPEPPTEVEIAREHESKKDEYLRKIEESLDNPSDENEYITNAIMRSKQMED